MTNDRWPKFLSRRPARRLVLVSTLASVPIVITMWGVLSSRIAAWPHGSAEKSPPVARTDDGLTSGLSADLRDRLAACGSEESVVRLVQSLAQADRAWALEHWKDSSYRGKRTGASPQPLSPSYGSIAMYLCPQWAELDGSVSPEISPTHLMPVRIVERITRIPLVLVPHPAHRSYIGAHEVSAGQWAQVLGDDDQSSKSCLPVRSVSLAQIQEFMRLSAFRLPDLFEWTTAALDLPEQIYRDRGLFAEFVTCGPGFAMEDLTPTPIGRKRATPLGFTDLLGNVWEWVVIPQPDGSREFGIIGGGYANLEWKYFDRRKPHPFPTGAAKPDLGFRVARDAE